MNPTRELDTAERIARDIDELDELESALTRNKDARLKVVRLRRRLDEAPSVRLSVAGKLLDLSVPTGQPRDFQGRDKPLQGYLLRRQSDPGLLLRRPRRFARRTDPTARWRSGEAHRLSPHFPSHESPFRAAAEDQT